MLMRVVCGAALVAVGSLGLGVVRASATEYSTATNPDGTISVSMSPGGAPVAVFTPGARTVTVEGKAYELREDNPNSTTDWTFSTTTYVKIWKEPFDGTFSTSESDWLTAARAEVADGDGDHLFKHAFTYVTGAAADAEYGPGSSADPQVGADWNDLLGIDHTYTYDGLTIEDRYERNEFGMVDCSGFVRLTFGRIGVRTAGTTSKIWLAASGEPRLNRLGRSSATQYGPDSQGVRVTPYDADAGIVPVPTNLRPGDLLFFDTDHDGDVNHVGINLGVSPGGTATDPIYTFVNSRKSSDGPTMGIWGNLSSRIGGPNDVGYTEDFVGARRL